ncbi:hypothetical protein ACFWP2_15825 [Kitasatospora sp. NPDC058444]|uniref:nucleotidyltransferase domain-containing protein n=1 Tax=Kitasatospora sp. NPDC058444 TaxID=3346504 RepID=UPI00364C66A5
MHDSENDRTRENHGTSEHDRAGEVAQAVELVRGWAAGVPHVRAVLVVGSWAHGEPTAHSDLDVLVLSSSPGLLRDEDGWLARFGGAVIRRKTWGAVEERRLRLPNGLTLELNVADLSWARPDPPDPGTRGVVAGGVVTVHDPDGLLRTLLTALDVPAVRPPWAAGGRGRP